MSISRSPHRLVGDELIAKVKEYADLNLTKTTLVQDCGYVREDGSLAFTDFYTALLDAKSKSTMTDADRKILNGRDIQPSPETKVNYNNFRFTVEGLKSK